MARAGVARGGPSLAGARYPDRVQTPRVFAYGTLLLPVVRERVTGAALSARPARLAGFERRRLRGETYPSLVPASGGAVDGLLLEGIDARALAALDAYEGPRYQRIAVRVQPADGGAPVEAWAWLLAAEHRAAVGEEPWDLERFTREHLTSFLASYEGLHPRT